MTLAVVHNLPHGGQKRALYHQVKQLSLKHKIDLYSLSISDNSFLPLKEFISKSYIFDYFQPPHFPQSVYSIYFVLPSVYKKMADQINSQNYDAVFVHPCFLTQSPYVLRYLKIPSIYYCPEPKREFYENFPRVGNKLKYNLTLPFRLPLKNIDRQNAQRSTIILTNSKYSKKVIDKAFCVNAKVNYLGVDTDLFRPYIDSSTSEESIRPSPDGVMATADEVGPPSEVSSTQSVLTVGDMSLHKGNDFIIKGLGLIPENFRPKLIIVGQGGSEKKYLVKLAKREGVMLELKENISDFELVNIYNKVLVFVYASHKEPFGMVLLEALACGLPIVAVDEGGVREIVRDNRLGVLTKRDEKEFAMQLNKILKRMKFLMKFQCKQVQNDRIYRHEWVRKNWSWENSVSELENYISQII